MSRTPGRDRIHRDDGVIVHDCLVYQDDRGHWWAMHGHHLMFGLTSDEILTEIARAVGSQEDLPSLQGRLARSTERAERMLREDEILRMYVHGR